jgi:HAD superfamily hydrolase (TIGR01509 family)
MNWRGIISAPMVDLGAYNNEVDARVKERLEAGVALKAGVIEILDLLDELNIPRAIVTSSAHATVDAHLGRSGILPRFHAVIARSDYARGKPHPDPLLRAAEVLKRPPARCLVLEDSHNGIRAAHAAGMIAIMVPDLLDATEEMRGLCFGVVETLHEVREGLLKWHGSARAA